MCKDTGSEVMPPISLFSKMFTNMTKEKSQKKNQIWMPMPYFRFNDGHKYYLGKEKNSSIVLSNIAEKNNIEQLWMLHGEFQFHWSLWGLAVPYILWAALFTFNYLARLLFRERIFQWLQVSSSFCPGYIVGYYSPQSAAFMPFKWGEGESILAFQSTDNHSSSCKYLHQ